MKSLTTKGQTLPPEATQGAHCFLILQVYLLYKSQFPFSEPLLGFHGASQEKVGQLLSAEQVCGQAHVTHLLRHVHEGGQTAGHSGWKLS